MDALAQECAALGRDPRDIEVTTGVVGRIPSRDETAQLTALGVGRVLVQLSDVSRDGVERALERVGNERVARA